MKIIPNFLIVGAAKSGTTSLYHLLKQHPEIYLPEHKEPRFFISEILNHLEKDNPRYDMFKSGTITDFNEYKKLFDKATNETAVGEASAEYLFYHKIAIPKIKKFLSNRVKIIIILRNPIERAFSSYFHLYRFGHEYETFEVSLKKEEERLKNNWGSVLFFHKNAGLYYEQVKSYKENFRDVKIYLLDDLIKEKNMVIENLYNFLDVETSFTPKTESKSNVGFMPKNDVIQRLIRNKITRQLKNSLYSISPNLLDKTQEKLFSFTYSDDLPSMDQSTKNFIYEYVKEDIFKLENLINRDLSSWRMND